jgi:hypothetical protein
VTLSPQAVKPLIAARPTVINAFFREKNCIRPPSFEVVEVTAAPRRMPRHSALLSNVPHPRWDRDSSEIETRLDNPGLRPDRVHTSSVTPTPTLPDTTCVR